MPHPSREFSEFAAALAGQYALERELGRGGMGVVYLARDLRLDRLVAIKTLPAHLASDARVRERFLHEARTAAALSHPGIAPIYRADELDGHVFFVMRYVDGASLAQLVAERGPLPPREVAGWLRDVAAALGAAHAHGVVHRDVKAENILVERATGRAIVTDFGIARSASAGPLTVTGLVLGTVYYMSPEQVNGEPLDGRSDLYSLGVTAYHALSGRFPFEHESASAVLVAHVTRTAPPLRAVAPSVPAALAAVVDRCLARDPRDRPASAAALVEALDAIPPAELAGAPPAAAPEPAMPRLSETEARRVWDRAARLQADTGAVAPVDPSDERVVGAAPAPSASQGYPLAHVRDAAREAGIPTGAVDRALAERGHVAPSASETAAPVVRDVHDQPNSPWTRGPRLLEFETVVAGEVPERDLDQVVETVRQALGDVGTVSAVGRALTWASSEEGRRVRVTVQPRNGRTTIRVAESLSPLAMNVFAGGGGVGFLAGLMGVGVVGNLTEQAVLAFGAMPVVLAGVYGASLYVLDRLTSGRRRALQSLTDRLAREVGEIVEAASVPPAGEAQRLPPRRHRTPV